MKYAAATIRQTLRAHQSRIILVLLSLVLAGHSIAGRFSSPIARHRSRLDALRPGPFSKPNSLTGYFSKTGVQWIYWQSQRAAAGEDPSTGAWMAALEAEQQALINLGVYERHWMYFPASLDRKHPLLRATSVGQTRYTLHFDQNRPLQIRVTAEPSEILEFKRAIGAAIGADFGHAP